MPWNTPSIMSLRLEFVTLAQQENANIAELCRRFGISRSKGYKWLERFEEGGVAALADRSRRPHRCPKRMSEEVRAALLKLREEHPAWGPRKLRRRLEDLGMKGLPAHSAISRLLRRPVV
jgi:transposase